jgi:transcriptional regulator with XRE-family HTH domain
MTMHASKRRKLEAAGYQVGDAADFLGLSPEEEALINMKVELSKQLVELRKKGGFSQDALAKMIGSSQSRVAKMEACDPSVSMDLMFKSAFALGADRTKIGKFIRSLSGVAATKRKAATKKRTASGKGVTKQKATAKRKTSARAAVA